MKKLYAVGCTVGFALFWVCGGLVVLGLVTGQGISVAALVLAVLGLALGVSTRLKLVELTRHLPTGTRVYQKEQAA